MNNNLPRLLQALCLSVLVFISACDKQQPEIKKESQSSTTEQPQAADSNVQPDEPSSENLEEKNTPKQATAATAVQSTDAIKQSFPDLKPYVLKNLDTGLDEYITVYYNPATARTISEKHPLSDPEMGEDIYRVLRGELLGKGKGEFVLDCDAGPSGDPSCSIVKENSDGTTKSVGSFGGLNFIIPGNGYVYVSGHTNNMFDTRQKFVWQNNDFSEVKQDAYYVGLNSKTNRAVELLQSKTSSRVVASLPAQSAVSVLINEGDYYLVKTPFGLTGWIKIEMGRASPIEGLFFRGD